MMPAPERWLNLAGPDVLRCIPESGLDVILSPGRLGLLEQGRDMGAEDQHLEVGATVADAEA